MKNYFITMACLFLLNQACKRPDETPEIAFDEIIPIGLSLDTIYVDSTSADTVSVLGNVNLKIYKGTHEVSSIVVRFWDSSFASVKKVNGRDSLVETLPAYEEKISPRSIDPFSLYAKERLSFVFYPKRNRLVKYCWSIYVIDSENKNSNTLVKSLIIKYP